MTRLELRKLEKTFGGAPALAGLDLDVAPGELVALLGPSGCGKTTALRCIAGLETPEAGEVLFDGAPVTGLEPQARRVGLVFQNFALFPHMTVVQNVAFGPRVRGAGRAARAAAARDMLRLVQLEGLEDRFPAQLSGGQQQRVALARTLLTEPRLLMLDEPLANLDAGLRAEMRAFLRDLQHQTGVTTLLVTHDQAEAMEMAHRVAVMLEGRVAQCAPPEELYRRPCSLAVARFMGAQNLLPAQRAGGQIHCALGALPCPQGAAAPGAGDGAVTLMLRAEAIDIAADPAALPPGAWQGRVLGREFAGPLVTYSFDTAAGALTVTQAARRLHAPGEVLWMGIAAADLWLLPGAAGAEIHQGDAA